MVLFIFNLYSNKRLCRLSPPSLSNITVLPSSMTRLSYTYRSVLNHCDVVPSSFLPLFLSSCAYIVTFFTTMYIVHTSTLGCWVVAEKHCINIFSRILENIII